MRMILTAMLLIGLAAQAAAEPIALRGVALIDGSGAPPVAGQTVLVEDGLISAVFPDGARPLPAGTRILDLPGHSLLPGLIDAHVHVNVPDQAAGGREALIRRREAEMAALLRSGVTALRELAGDAGITADLARRQAAGTVPGPLIRFAAVFFGREFMADPRARLSAGEQAPGQAPWSRLVTPELDLDAAMAAARGAGASGVKLYASLDAQELAALSQAARRHGLLVWTHSVVFPAGAREAVAAGADSLIHAKGMVSAAGTQDIPRDFDTGTRQWMMSRPFAEIDADGPTMRALFAEMVRQGTILEPALMADGDLAPQPLPPPRAAMRAWACRATGAAHRAGVAIGAGTDSADWRPGILQRELARLVACGLSPLEAIRAATSVNARALGIADTHGTIAPGMAADLIVVAGNPAEDIAALNEVRLVMQAGRIVAAPGAAP